eukprot:2655514-Alexandrium_andersonii.AAC.1
MAGAWRAAPRHARPAQRGRSQPWPPLLAARVLDACGLLAISADGPEARAEGAVDACLAAFPARKPLPLAELRAVAG